MGDGNIDLIKIYIENLNIPQEKKQKLLESKPKTLNEISLWLEKNQENSCSNINPFKNNLPQLKTELAKEIALFNNNSNTDKVKKTTCSNNLFNNGIVSNDDASWGLGIERTQRHEKVYYSSNITSTKNPSQTSPNSNSNKYYDSNYYYADAETVAAQNNAISSIKENVNNSIEIIMAQNEEQGVVSKAYNSIKEYFKSEMALSSVCRNIYTENFCAEMLELAQNGELTTTKYCKAKIEEAKAMLTGNRELTEEETLYLNERLSYMSLDEINILIDKIKNCDNEQYSQLNDYLSNLIQEGKTILNTSKSDSYSHSLSNIKESPNSIRSIIQSSKGEKPMTFEEVFNLERGVEFNSQAIEKYENTAAKYAMVTVITNKANNLHEILDESIKAVDSNEELGANKKVKEQCEQELENNLINALKTLYNDESKINEILQEASNGNISYTDGNIVYDQSLKNKKGSILSTISKNLLSDIDERVNKIKGPYNIEDYKNEMGKAYEKAYGMKNATQLAKAFQSDQEEIVGKIRSGVEYTGVGVMVAGMFFCPPLALAGAITASFGGIGVEALNESTRKEGLNDEAKKKITQELITNAALFAVGGAAGKMGSAAKSALLAQKCPTLMACIADIGTDATISMLGDLAITGEIDIEGEGLSQIMSLIAGHVKVSKFGGNKKSNVNTENTTKNNIANTNTAKNIKQKIENKYKLKDSVSMKISEEIAQIISSKPELSEKIMNLIDSNVSLQNIRAIAEIATKDNIELIEKLTKNKNIKAYYDSQGNLIRNDFDNAIKAIKNNPEISEKLIDIAQNSKHNGQDLQNIADLLKKYPDYNNEIMLLVKSNYNIKVGKDIYNNPTFHIEKIIEKINQYPNLRSEIIDFMKVQRKADNDTSNPVSKLDDYIQLLNSTPNQELTKKLAQNPNLDVQEIKLLSHKKLSEQQIDDIVFLSNKKYSENAINYNLKLVQQYPELRDIIFEEAPKYELIDNNIQNTPQSTINERNYIRNQIAKNYPEKLKELESTLGKDFYEKVKWEEIIPKNATNAEIEKTLSYLNETSKFFSRIGFNEKSYGKNIQWAHEMRIIQKTAEVLAKKGLSFDTIMNHISSMYRDFDIAKTLESNQGASDRRIYSGEYRGFKPDDPAAVLRNNGAYTPYNKEDGYSEYYNKFEAVKDKKRTPPYDDVVLTEIRSDAYIGNHMAHPLNSTVENGMSHVKDAYNSLEPFRQKVKNGEKLTQEEIKQVHKKVSEIYFLMANIMPYSRGSNGISDILMRNIYQSLGINMPALKQGVSLDLEAFCTKNMDEYQEKWLTFFEN